MNRDGARVVRIFWPYMIVGQTELADVLLVDPQVHEDDRGWFLESWNRKDFLRATGIEASFVQHNHSRSVKSVLRGLHYQLRQPQAKLVRVTAGAVFDVAVDVRRTSPTFGKWFGAELSEHNRHQLWIPQGCAHGFLVLSDYADVLYQTTDYYAAEWDRSIRWDDPDIGIDWPIGDGEPVLSPKDAGAPYLSQVDTFD